VKFAKDDEIEQNYTSHNQLKSIISRYLWRLVARQSRTVLC